MIQNEELEGTPLEGCEFSSVERDDSGENQIACENIDFVIIQKDLSAEDAQTILNWLLEVLINDTTEETAILNGYISTKLNNIEIEQINVNIDVLKITPYIGDFQNSPTGEDSIGDWGTAFLKTLQDYVSMIISLVQSIVELINFIVDAIVRIAMAVLSFLGDLIWLLIRAAILIFIWIMFVLTLIAFIGVFLIMIPIMAVLSLIIGAELLITFNSIRMIKEAKEVGISYSIQFDYIDFLDIYIPTLKIVIKIDDMNYEILMNLFSLETSNVPTDIIPGMNTVEQSQIQTYVNYQNNIKNSSDSENESELSSELILSGFLAALGITGVFMSIYGFAAKPLRSHTFAEIGVFILTLFAFGISMVIFIEELKHETEHFSSFLYGFAIGLLFASDLISVLYLLEGDHKIFHILHIIEGGAMFIYIISGIFYHQLGIELLKIPLMIIDLIVIGFGAAQLHSIEDDEKTNRAFLAFIMLTFLLSIGFFIAADFIHE